MTPEAERFNGWAAMLGFVAAVGAYVTTGQIIPGWFQDLISKIKIQGFVNFLLKLPFFFGNWIENKSAVISFLDYVFLNILILSKFFLIHFQPYQGFII